MAKLLNGRETSAKIKEQIKNELIKIYKTTDKRCSLAVVLVGNDSASQVYVKNKIKACEEVGIKSVFVQMEESASQQEVEQKLRELVNSDIDGILVQLPLPKHLNEKNILAIIPPEKDVDGFCEQNVGRLLLGQDAVVACTPNGIIRLLKENGVELCGKRAVVIGRSNIVGKPMAVLLLAENCTVSVCHKKTDDLSFYTKNADIVVVAVGKPKFLKADMVKKGAVVVDVGMDRDENGALCGDVDFEQVEKVASFITPVPGGVGPMTIAMLMYNTFEIFKKKL